MFLRGISMKKLLEILRLHFNNNLSSRQIAKVANTSKTTVSKYINLFKQSKLPWPLPEEYLDEQALCKALDPGYSDKKDQIFDFVSIHQELRSNKKVTLQLLWEELNLSGNMPCSYSNFALTYRNWLNKQPNYMRQTHKGGEKVFVDYSGDKVKIIDTDTQTLREAEIFVGVMGASNYIYLEATWSQNLNDWVNSHVRMFEHLGGTPQLVIPDNLKSGVRKANRYDPDITPAYYKMLSHYATAAMPARVATPKDKAKVETGVLIIQRWVLARLRHETIYGLSQLNAKLKQLMEFANNKQMKKYPQTRKQLFDKLDKPNLKVLPQHKYKYLEYKKSRVGSDYHVELSGHYYSVPYNLVKQEVDIWYSSNTVECYYQNKCIAKHIRSTEANGHTSNIEHMPPQHKQYLALTPERMLQWSASIGIATNLIVEDILNKAPHSEIGCRRSHGFLNLSKKYGSKQLELACDYAICNGIYDYKHIENIIKNNLIQNSINKTPVIHHSNIRGANYYH